MAIPLPAVLINSVVIDVAGAGAATLRSGKIVNDTATQAAVLAAGGQLANPSDPLIAAALVIAAKARSRGANETQIDLIMMSAAEDENFAEVQIGLEIAIGASATVQVEPSPVQKTGTLATLTITPKVTPDAGESAVLQLQKNGTSVPGATVTVNAATAAVASTPIAFPMAGATYVPTDKYTMVVTYVAGGSPQLTGANANAYLTGAGA